MIQDFDAWSSGRSETNSFSDLSGSVLAIEASFYLDRLLNQPPSKEPLLPALGGLPFSLRVYVQNDLDALSEYGIRPLFVFNGIEAGKKHSPFKDLEDAARLNDNAWELYNRHEAEQAVDSFGKSGEYHVSDEATTNVAVEFTFRMFATRGLLPDFAENPS